MELRDLRAFLAVIDAGSFTAAARELGYTQSAVSQQIAGLEAELGRRLVDRHPVRPTTAGTRLAQHAARILLRVDVARSEVIGLADETRLCVGVCPPAAPAVLAGALRELCRATPGLRVTVRSTSVDVALADVAAARLDVAFVNGITAPDSPLALTDAGVLASVALAEVPVCVALPTGHPLQRRRSLDLTTLTDAPWVSAPSMSWDGAPPASLDGRVTYEGHDLATLLELVAAGHGCALVPALGADPVEGVVTVPLSAPDLVHRTEIVTLPTPAAAAQRLIVALRDRSPTPALHRSLT